MMRAFFLKRIAAIIVASAASFIIVPPHRAEGQQVDDTRREQIGKVLGEPVFRDEIQSGQGLRLEDEMHRLFLRPLARRYYETHQEKIEPTPLEITEATAFIRQKMRDNPGEKQSMESALREQLNEINTQLATGKLSEQERKHLGVEKVLIEKEIRELPAEIKKTQETTENSLTDFAWKILLQIAQRGIEERLVQEHLTKEEFTELQQLKQAIEFFIEPDRAIAVSMLTQWKIERHRYENYGGGRVLWQQEGWEAFDANRKWLETEEQAGNFEIIDPKLRQAFYKYWTQSHHNMLEDEAETRQEFLELHWGPRSSE